MKNSRTISRGWLSSERKVGLIFTIIAIIGFLETLFADWNIGPALPGVKHIRLMPQIYYIILLCAGVLIICEKSKNDNVKSPIPEVKAYHIVIFIGMGFIYFFVMLKVGLIFVTFLYSAIFYAIITPSPLKHWKQIIIPSIILTLFLWVLFGYFMKIILVDPLLI